MKNYILLFLAFTSLTIISCGDDDGFCINEQGPKITKTLSIADFSSIDLSVDADVIISQGNQQEVRVKGSANIINRLETRVKSNVWDIELDGNCFRNYDLTIFITIPNLSEIYLTGSGTITINDFNSQSELSLKISGSGEIILNEFQGLNNLSAEITGSGEIIANRQISDVDQLDIVVRGSGDFKGFSIFSNECDVRITGSGDCEVRATEKLNVTISGSGDVMYKGQPMINQDITGSGDLKDAN